MVLYNGFTENLMMPDGRIQRTVPDHVSPPVINEVFYSISAVKYLGIRHPRLCCGLRIQGRELLERTAIFLTQCQVSSQGMLDSVNWYSQFC